MQKITKHSVLLSKAVSKLRHRSRFRIGSIKILMGQMVMALSHKTEASK